MSPSRQSVHRGAVHTRRATIDSFMASLSPAGMWKHAESSGTQATDSSGNDRHGTYIGGFTLGASGPAGLPAVELNGSTGNAELNGDFDAFSSADFSVMAAVRLDTLGVEHAVITKDHVPSGGGGGLAEWGLWVAGDGRVVADVYRTDNLAFLRFIDAGVTIAAGAWVDLMMTVAGTTLRLLINGVERGSSSSTSGSRTPNSTTNVMIGRRNHFLGGAEHRFLDGRIAYSAYVGRRVTTAEALERARLLGLA